MVLKAIIDSKMKAVVNKKVLGVEKTGVYQQVLHPPDYTKKATYINVTIRDASEAVYTKVHTALRRINLVAPKLLPKLKGKVANKIATEASKHVPPAQIALVLSDRLPKLLMYIMYHKHGMTISAQTVFIEKGYIVIQLQVLHVDAKRLLATQTTTTTPVTTAPASAGAVSVGADIGGTGSSTDEGSVMEPIDMNLVEQWLAEQQQQLLDQAATRRGDSRGSHAPGSKSTTVAMDDSSSSSNSDMLNPQWWMQTALGLLPDATKKSLESTTLPELVQTKLTERMQQLLVQQLAHRQLCAETAVLPEEEQARFFFAYLQQHRKRHHEEQIKKQGKNTAVIKAPV
jgi:hypothetical protein